jgi:hypothetical protein
MLELIKMLVMLDLSSLFRIEKIIVEIIDTGVIKVTTQEGFPIKELSGDWTMIHKIVEILDINKRKQFVRDNYNESYSPSLYIKLVTTNDTGKEIISLPISFSKLLILSNVIKKKSHGTSNKHKQSN